MRMNTALTMLACFALSACGSAPYRGMYEAIKSRNESTQPPAERSVTPTPSYDQYQKERETKP